MTQKSENNPNGKRKQDQVTKAPQVFNLALQIKVVIDKQRLGTKQLTTAEYSNINWADVQDTKADVRKVVARSCQLDPATVVVQEAIPDETGIQSPSLMISFKQELSDAQMDLVRRVIVGYFDLLPDPEKPLPTVPGEALGQELEDYVRETAKDFCARRNGRALPCEIVMTDGGSPAPIKFKVKVAKPKHPLHAGEIYNVEGKADGYKCSKHKLEFLQRKTTTSKKGVKKLKFKSMKIGFDQKKFEQEVMALPHGKDVIIKLSVQDFMQGKKRWTSLIEIVSTGSKKKN